MNLVPSNDQCEINDHKDEGNKNYDLIQTQLRFQISFEFSNDIKKLDILLIWVESDYKNTDIKDFKKILKKLFKDVIFLKSSAKYIQYENQKVKHYVLATGRIGQEIIQTINKQDMVEHVIIFCQRVDYHKQWASNHKKVKCVTNQYSEIVSKFQEIHKQYDFNTEVKFMSKNKLAIFYDFVTDKHEFQNWQNDNENQSDKHIKMQGFCVSFKIEEYAKESLEQTFNTIPLEQKSKYVKILIKIELNKQKSQNLPVDLEDFNPDCKFYQMQINTILQVKNIQVNNQYIIITTKLYQNSIIQLFKPLLIENQLFYNKNQYEKIVQNTYTLLIWIDEDLNKDYLLNQHLDASIPYMNVNVFLFDKMSEFVKKIQQLSGQNTDDKIFIISSGKLCKQVIDYTNKNLQMPQFFILCQKVKNIQVNNQIKCIEDDFLRIKICIERYKQYYDMNQRIMIRFQESEYQTILKKIFFIIQLFSKFQGGYVTRAIEDFELFANGYLQFYEVKLIEDKNQEKEKLKVILNILYGQQQGDYGLIQQYIEDSFLHRLINNIIYEGDIEKLYRIRILIFSLYSQINYHSIQQKNKNLTLYIGCVIKQNELDDLKKNKKPFMIQGFNYITKNIANAKDVIGYINKNLDEQNKYYKTLIQIQIDEDKENKVLNIHQFKNDHGNEEYIMQVNTFLQFKNFQKQDDYTIIICDIYLNQIDQQISKKIDQILTKNYPIEYLYLLDLLRELNQSDKIGVLNNLIKRPV